ncbi:MAG: YceI family protein [Actinomycetes bacterium]
MTTTTNTLATTTGTWVIDQAHTTIGFSARHAVVAKTRGKFSGFSGTLVLDAENVAGSKIDVTIQAASFDSGNADRDAHIKSADFLDAETYPTLTFVSTGLRHKGGNEFEVEGDLSIHGVTKSVTIAAEFTGNATDPYGNQKIGFEGKASISRKDFGLTWNVVLEAGGVMVSDHITIELDVEADKQV